MVIGGGFAGLSAAAAARRTRARECLSLDARAQLGGRATAFRDRDTGELVDNGQHVLFGCYRATFEFLDRIDAADRVRVQPSLTVPYHRSQRPSNRSSCPALPSPFHLLAGVLGWDALRWRDRLSVLRLARRFVAPAMSSSAPAASPHTPNGTVSEWLIAHGQRRQLRSWLWEPLAVAALNQSPAVAAAAPIRPRAGEMFGPDPHDSATRPADPSAARDVCRTRAAIHRVARRRGARSMRWHAWSSSTDASRGVDIRGEPHRTHSVIAAVPWFDLGRLFGRCRLRSLRQ